MLLTEKQYYFFKASSIFIKAELPNETPLPKPLSYTHRAAEQCLALSCSQRVAWSTWEDNSLSLLAVMATIDSSAPLFGKSNESAKIETR